MTDTDGADLDFQFHAAMTTLADDARLVLDTGTFHGLTGPQRAAMGREITAVAAVDATVLLDVFAPGRRGPLPRGATPSDIDF